MAQVDIFVFSFNRGPWLKNLLESITRLFSPEMDSKLIIFDDHSTDSFTLEVLAEARQNGAQVLHASDFVSGLRGSRGGLHAGIEAALSKVARPDALALLLQDDMQIVRPVDSADIEGFRLLIQKSGNPFLYINFWTGGGTFRQGNMQWHEGYFVKHSRRERRYRGYTDVCLVDVKRLRTSGFNFRESEKAMDHEAARLFPPMAWTPFPITAMLPDPVVYRDGEALAGTIYRFVPWPQEKVESFLTRSVPQDLPIAEDHLRLDGLALSGTWQYGVEAPLKKRALRAIRRLLPKGLRAR